MSSSARINLKAILSYDGYDFFGWQKTKMGPSIEEELQKALEMLLQEPIYLQAASRTDAKVHAHYQVVQFYCNKADVNLPSLLYRLNQVLPNTISVLSLEKETDSFHPTLDCKNKEYHYLVCNEKIQLPMRRHYSWHVKKKIDLKLVEEAIPSFIGKKDFSWLCNKKCESYVHHICSLKKISFSWNEHDEIVFSLEADRFLYKMARNIVGTLVYIGIGKMQGNDIKALFENKDRKLAGICAPAHGLYLNHLYFTSSGGGGSTSSPSESLIPSL